MSGALLFSTDNTEKTNMELDPLIAGLNFEEEDEPKSSDHEPIPAPTAMDDRAYYGIAGEIVKAIEPHTEADPAALLVQTLVAFGNLVGRGAFGATKETKATGPYFQVEGSRHYSNLFALIIGATSKSRKGTSWGRVQSIFEQIDKWPNVLRGLQTGEGLKWRVRDEVWKLAKDKESGEMIDQLKDAGVEDKRLLVVAPEFGGVLVKMKGATLSQTLRDAWDSGYLDNPTKNDPITVTNAHISIIGHITAEELLDELTQTQIANGFANRFLFVYSKRMRYQPRGGGDLPEEVVKGFVSRLKRAAEACRLIEQVTMTGAAWNVWDAGYEELSEPAPGLFGKATDRAEAQVRRLALVYALLDGSREIDVEHLQAALAVWEYAEASARYVFGSGLGDPVADEIDKALRAAGPNGMTRTEIRDHFKRHRTGEEIDRALAILLKRNRASCRRQPTGGRSAEVWTSVASVASVAPDPSASRGPTGA